MPCSYLCLRSELDLCCGALDAGSAFCIAQSVLHASGPPVVNPSYLCLRSELDAPFRCLDAGSAFYVPLHGRHSELPLLHQMVTVPTSRFYVTLHGRLRTVAALPDGQSPNFFNSILGDIDRVTTTDQQLKEDLWACEGPTSLSLFNKAHGVASVDSEIEILPSPHLTALSRACQLCLEQDYQCVWTNGICKRCRESDIVKEAPFTGSHGVVNNPLPSQAQTDIDTPLPGPQAPKAQDLLHQVNDSPVCFPSINENFINSTMSADYDALIGNFEGVCPDSQFYENIMYEWYIYGMLALGGLEGFDKPHSD
ncbi:hypothetical protein GYMLUDRAFT_249457 [Collybiopsis luxurians FD-317 M1]|uniref:Uncharacterized protein n=1 Tax=Collybiopsis luxurians FD-317 M1 TaxID=944289 RepID=A0A0D0BXL5_9AGAR|nr:hypothetical protein GYMLUDRAFT_249457 [Collybiopsis luxurians FD-317 M1]